MGRFLKAFVIPSTLMLCLSCWFHFSSARALEITVDSPEPTPGVEAPATLTPANKMPPPISTSTQVVRGPASFQEMMPVVRRMAASKPKLAKALRQAELLNDMSMVAHIIKLAQQGDETALKFVVAAQKTRSGSFNEINTRVSAFYGRGLSKDDASKDFIILGRLSFSGFAEVDKLIGQFHENRGSLDIAYSFYLKGYNGGDKSAKADLERLAAQVNEAERKAALEAVESITATFKQAQPVFDELGDLILKLDASRRA